ncbi:hypothetical protein [Silanimonas sp.]|jgi:hypothetical protein|uniref:hypothetical protein n=1 Tax=Silanimonas sp. TaxID=1929290 RepID=UPI0037C6C6C5
MTVACPPLLRVALHALLALAVLLQASVAVAMHASPVAGATGDTPAPVATEAATTLPPCHALVAAVVDANPATAADCCGDSALGESCRWACAQALGMTPLLVLTSQHLLAAGPSATPILPALRWTAQSPLRPPIG